MFITVTVIVVSTVIVNYLFFVYLFIHSFTEKSVGGAFEYEY